MTEMTIETAFPCGRPKILEMDGSIALVAFGELPFFAEIAGEEINLRVVVPVLSGEGRKISIGGKSIRDATIIAGFDIPIGANGETMLAPLTAAGLEDFILAAIDQAVGSQADTTRNIVDLLASIVSLHTGSPQVTVTSIPAGLCFYLPDTEEEIFLRNVGADIGARIARLRSCAKDGRLYRPGTLKHDFHDRSDGSGHDKLAAVDAFHAAMRDAGLDARPVFDALMPAIKNLMSRLSS